MAIFIYGQKALLGTVVLQDNFIEFQHTSDSVTFKVTNHHRPSQFPTLSFSYLKFRGPKGYDRYFMSGWHYAKIEDYQTMYTPNGLNFVGGGDVKLYTGRLGYARGLELLAKNQNRFIFIEGELSAGFQHNRYQPYSFNQYSRIMWAAYSRLGVNLVIQKNYKNAFLRLMAAVPVLQLNSEHYRIQDSIYPSLITETNTTSLKTQAWQLKGFEVGAGWFLGR